MLSVLLNGIDMSFNTKPSLFSPGGADAGTLAMLTVIKFGEAEKVLDLGCGYGIVGIYAAKIIGAKNVYMLDINREATEIAAQNAVLNNVAGVSVVLSDGFRSLDETGFTLVLCNPPYHTDFSVAKHFIEKGFNRLKIGGKMVMVTKRKDWYRNKLVSVFGGVSVKEADGYFIFMAEKRSADYANMKK